MGIMEQCPLKGTSGDQVQLFMGNAPCSTESWKTPPMWSDRKCNNDRNLGNMSFEERLMDTLYHLLKIKPQREVHDCRCSCLIILGFGTNLCSGFSAGKMPVYLLECSVLRQYSSTEKMIPKSPFFAEKKYRRYRLLSLGFANTLLLKGENNHSISRSCRCLPLKNFNKKFGEPVQWIMHIKVDDVPGCPVLACTFLSAPCVYDYVLSHNMLCGNRLYAQSIANRHIPLLRILLIKMEISVQSLLIPLRF